MTKSSKRVALPEKGLVDVLPKRKRSWMNFIGSPMTATISRDLNTYILNKRL